MVVEGAARVVVVVVVVREGLGRDVLDLIPSWKRKLYILFLHRMCSLYTQLGKKRKGKKIKKRKIQIETTCQNKYKIPKIT